MPNFEYDPLTAAVCGGEVEIVRQLLDAGADPNVKSTDPEEREKGLTPLMHAVARPTLPNCDETFDLLLACGADPHVLTRKGNSALSRAVAHDNSYATKRLLEIGCKPDGSLLLRPIYRGQLDILRAFIAAGADVNVRGIWSQLKSRKQWEDAPTNCTILDGAVGERTDKIQLLRNLLPAERPRLEERLKSVADVSFTMIQELIRAGADVNNVVSSVSPLYQAADSGDLETVKLLLQAGANPNLARDLPRDMPLHRACCGGHVQIVECLLKAGADVKMLNKKGRTALEELRQTKKTHEIEIWEMAINQGTKVDPGEMRVKYDEWNRNRAALISLLERIPGSAQ